MIVDGKQIAADIYSELDKELRSRTERPSLLVFVCDPNPETRKYLSLKQDRAMQLGIDVLVMEFDRDSSTTDFLEAMDTLLPRHSGLILQLPFPAGVDVDLLIEKIPPEKDIDVMRYTGEGSQVLPPVVGAVVEISKRHNILIEDKKVAVVGQGKLVGKPAALWAATSGATVTVVDKNTAEAEVILKDADIIISGAGVPGLITPEKIKEGVVIFDAGTSEEGGVLKGDAEPACAQKCSLFTPVPGGIGPITIAVLLKNLVLLSRDKK